MKSITPLSQPLTVKKSFDDTIEACYSFFVTNIQDRDTRPWLRGKELFIDVRKQIQGKPISFWHFIGIKEQYHFKVLPCVNTPLIEHCPNNCNDGVHTIQIDDSEKRNLCLLRAIRIPWFLDIIHIANNKPDDLKIWSVPHGNQPNKLHLWYEHGGCSYIVIFSDEKYYYRLISAFPVFMNSDRIGFCKDYEKYKYDFENEKDHRIR